MDNGKENFNKNFREAINKMIKGSHVGLRLSGALVKKESQKKSPVDEGNLKASHYTEFRKGSGGAVIEIGLNAKYAVYVHEIITPTNGVKRTGKKAKGYYWDSGEPKFLEKAIDENVDTIRKLIQKHAKL